MYWTCKDETIHGSRNIFVSRVQEEGWHVVSGYHNVGADIRLAISVITSLARSHCLPRRKAQRKLVGEWEKFWYNISWSLGLGARPSTRCTRMSRVGGKVRLFGSKGWCGTVRGRAQAGEACQQSRWGLRWCIMLLSYPCIVEISLVFWWGGGRSGGAANSFLPYFSSPVFSNCELLDLRILQTSDVPRTNSRRPKILDVQDWS